MTIYILLVSIVIVGYPVVGLFTRKQQKLMYCVLVGIATALVMGLRSRYVGGVDTDLSYIPAFERICRQTMSEVIARHGAKDVTFYICTKLITYVSDNVVLYLLIISSFVSYAYSRFIYRYSEDPVLSYLMFLSLGFFATGFQQLRQVIALSIMLFAYDALKNRNLRTYGSIVLIATMFHLASILFIIAYPLAKMKNGIKQWFAMIVVVFMCIAAKETIFKVLSIFTSGTRFENYLLDTYGHTLSVSGTIILLSIYIAGLTLSQRSTRNEIDIRIPLNMSALAVCFVALTLVIAEFQRLSKGFSVYNLILIPNVLKFYKVDGKHTKRSLLYTSIIAVILIIYFVFFGLGGMRMLPYQFFWQD